MYSFCETTSCIFDKLRAENITSFITSVCLVHAVKWAVLTLLICQMSKFVFFWIM